MTTTKALAKLVEAIVGSGAGKNSVAKNLTVLAENWSSMPKKGVHVAGASGSTVTKAEFAALLTALENANILAKS